MNAENEKAIQPVDSAGKLARPRYAWEGEETLVERRQRLRYRIWRFITWNKWYFVGLFVLVNFLFNASFSRWLAGIWPSISPHIERGLFFVMFIIFQFGMMFWFLGRARMYTIWPGAEGVSFDDYRGQPELLEQARQIVKLLRGVRVFEEAGGEPLNGLLLEGPPGTGKTWLAQAISTEAGVPFFYVDASGMSSMFFGIAPMKVMNLYRKARNAAKDYGAAIIFIDEIDAIGARGGVATKGEGNLTDVETPASPKSPFQRLPIMFGGMGGSNSGLLSTLLVEMSGFSLEHGWWARKRTWWYKNILRRKPPKPNKRVLTIGATNRVHTLDPALLRPGRFDKKIRVDAPDMAGRRDIFAYYLSKMAHDDSLDPLILASETLGYTPADIKYLLNEALRYALFDGRTYIMYRDVRLAQPEHEMGLRSPIKNMMPEDRYRLAAHEAGHAVAVRLFRPNYRISRITIIRQGGAHGHVMSYPATEEFDYLSTFEKLMNDLRVSIAGKAGEMEFAGEGSQTLGVGVGFGDGSDFGTIRNQLRRMANAGMFGMVGASGRLTKDLEQRMEETFHMVLDEVRMTLRMEREMVEALIQVLVDKEEMLADEVEAFFDQYGLYTPKVQISADEQAPIRVAHKENGKPL